MQKQACGEGCCGRARVSVQQLMLATGRELQSGLQPETAKARLLFLCCWFCFSGLGEGRLRYHLSTRMLDSVFA
jgi:hypothetical protein